ncbi:MAG: phytanoyl-CoA dioxygenase family protein [Bdellovibrionota bacterium]
MGAEPQPRESSGNPESFSGGLTPAQIAHYEEHGYVVAPGVLSPEEIERYKVRARAIVYGGHPPEAKSRVVQDLRVYKGLAPAAEDLEHNMWKILNPDVFDPVFDGYLRTPKLLNAVESLIGPDILAFLLMFIYKPPHREESVHPFHQDAVYFPFAPHAMSVGTWLPLDDAHADNGTLQIIPGSHKWGLHKYTLPEGGKFGMALGLEATGAKDLPDQMPLNVKAGDCVLFHTHLLHTTLGNKTDHHRRVITIHFASAKCKPMGHIKEFGFQLVRGRTYEKCLQPQPRSLHLNFV